MLVISLISAFFLVLGVALMIYEIRFDLRASATTEGIVIDLVRGGRSGKYPLVQFQPMEAGLGKKDVVFKSSVSSSPALHRIGDRVPVVYDPTNPEHARIDTFMNRWFFPWVFIVIGFFFLLFLPLHSHP